MSDGAVSRSFVACMMARSMVRATDRISAIDPLIIFFLSWRTLASERSSSHPSQILKMLARTRYDPISIAINL